MFPSAIFIYKTPKIILGLEFSQMPGSPLGAPPFRVRPLGRNAFTYPVVLL
jgi:hypothetical protein